MRQRTVIRLITLVSVLALLGLVIIQAMLLQRAFRFQEQVFERNALNALQDVSRELEKREATRAVLTVVQNPDETATVSRVRQHRLERIVREKPPGQAEEPTTRMKEYRFEFNLPDTLELSADTVRFTLPAEAPVRLWLRRQEDGREVTLLEKTLPPGPHEVPLDRDRFREGTWLVLLAVGGTTRGCLLAEGAGGGQTVTLDGNLERKEQLVGDVMNLLVRLEGQPLTERLAGVDLPAMLRERLAGVGIRLPFSYAVFCGDGQVAHPDGVPAETAARLRQSAFEVGLYPSDLFAEEHRLRVHFPGRETYILGQIWPMLGASGGFILLLVLNFAYILLTIRRQGHFARRLTDFINNMTHEFKTPLSTIGLACETMAAPGVAGDEAKVERCRDIIREEIGRMRRQTDKILQLAVIEEGTGELDLERIDVHELAREVVRNFVLQVESRGGRLDMRLDAARTVIDADPVHLANILHNLLENALKYSRGAPRITVATRDEADGLVVTVADEGIGIEARHLPHVFEKYYRTATGDRHDVKGFGLGLSYVRLLVEAMNGRVRLASRPGEGTTVTLTFPTAGEPHE
ncbi:MAG: HAMP domain-containing histidine kinase [Acidobacteria bacterium]|nr:HAMP domain-containing histidine kinase [Acidobacteriota bacterium]